MEEINSNDLNIDEETSRIKIMLDGNDECSEKTIRIGDMAPKFCAKTTMGDIKLTDYCGKWLILFSHPR